MLNKNNLFSNNWIYLEDYFVNLNLRHLALSSCSLNESVVDIAKILQHHSTLQILELSHNQINDSSFIYFKSFPIENLSLVELDFSRNYISDKSGKYFFENLLNNKCIQKLNFFDNQLQNESANAVIESLRLNNSLIYVNFKSNRVPIIIMKEINKRIQSNKLIEKENFLPQLKREIRDLSFDPEEINLLKQRIISQSQEKELTMKKLKEDTKMIKMKKLEKEKELNKVESESNDILSKINKINKEIRSIMDKRETEMINFKDEIEKIEESMNVISYEIEKKKKENKRYKDKYDDIFQRLKKTYDITYKKYEDQRRLLMVEIDQLKSKKTKYASKIRILDKLKNGDKMEKIENKYENNAIGTYKSIKSENNNNQYTPNLKENEDKITMEQVGKNRIKIRRNSIGFNKKKERKLKLKEKIKK